MKSAHGSAATPHSATDGCRTLDFAFGFCHIGAPNLLVRWGPQQRPRCAPLGVLPRQRFRAFCGVKCMKKCAWFVVPSSPHVAVV